MKIRHALFIFLLGILVDVVAGTFKILHLQGAVELLYVAVILKVVGGIALLVKLLTHPKAKEFLDW